MKPEDIIFNNVVMVETPDGEDADERWYTTALHECGVRVADAIELQADEADLMFMLRTGWTGR